MARQQQANLARSPGVLTEAIVMLLEFTSTRTGERCRRRRARISSPCIGWTLGEPFFALWTCNSISAVVRYSRGRTEEFTVVGADRPPLRFSTIFCPRSQITSELPLFPL